jgi:hypothetical protein
MSGFYSKFKCADCAVRRLNLQVYLTTNFFVVSLVNTKDNTFSSTKLKLLSMPITHYIRYIVYTYIYIYFTALVTGHGKTRAYPHRFKLLESSTSPCGKEEQTTDHLINRWILLQKPKETLKRESWKNGIWPINKQRLTFRNRASYI